MSPEAPEHASSAGSSAERRKLTLVSSESPDAGETPSALEISSHDRGRRIRRLLQLSLGLWAGYTLYYAALGRYGAAAIQAGCAVALLVVRQWVRGDPETRANTGGHLIVIVINVGLTTLAFMSGQGDSVVPWALTLSPLMAAYQLGARAAAIWTAISAVEIFAVHISVLFTGIDPSFVVTGGEVFFGQVLLLTLILIFSLTIRAAADRQLQELHAREVQLQAQARALENARDVAVHAAQAKTDFLSNVTHEIRTPMTAILGFAKLLQASDLTRLSERQQQAALDSIQRNGEHLLTLINDVLDFSKVEAGKLELEFVSCPPGRPLQEAMDMVAHAAREKGLYLRTSVRDSVPQSFTTDPLRLKQIFVNLLDNAVKFTESGGITVTVYSDMDPQVGKAIVFKVQDTGMGIPRENLSSIFEAFVQGETASNRRFRGTGLGLAISRQLARRLGGYIFVASTPDIGSTFTLVLPAGMGGAE